MADRIHPPIHPGEVLKEDFMNEFGLSARQVAKLLGVPANRVSQIVRGQRSISADTALRLSRWLGTTPELWLRLQERYDLEVAKMQVGAEIERTVTPRQLPEIPSPEPAG